MRYGLLTLTLASLSVAAACGESMTDEELAQQGAMLAGETVRGLTVASEVGTDASMAQQDDDRPNEPDVGAAPCVQTRFENDALVVDYGAGCQVGRNFISGAYALRLLLDRRLGLGIEFRAFVVNGLRHDGDAFVGLGEARISAGMDLTLTEDQVVQTVDFDGTLWGDDVATNFDGAGAYDDGQDRWAFDATNLRIVKGECYPEDGVVTVELPDQPIIVVTFTMATPQTGDVLVRVNQAEFTVRLPAYDGCPPAP